MSHISTPPNYVPKPDPKHTPVFIDNTSAPTCKVCDKGKLISKKVYKFGAMCAIAGIIIAIPCIIVAITSFYASMLLFGQNDDDGVAVIGLMFSALAFAAGGLGYFLAQTKKILRCNKCGATIEAS